MRFQHNVAVAPAIGDEAYCQIYVAYEGQQSSSVLTTFTAIPPDAPSERRTFQRGTPASAASLIAGSEVSGIKNEKRAIR